MNGGFIGDLPRLILVKHRAAQMTEISDWLVRAAGARVVDVSDEETIRSMIELARSGMYVKPCPPWPTQLLRRLVGGITWWL